MRRLLGMQLGMVMVSVLLAAATPLADEWPEFRGTGRRGVWNETGILDQFPAEGLKVLWRAPVNAGYSGPLVAINVVTGKVLWKKDLVKDYDADNGMFGFSSAPIIDGDRLIAFVGQAGAKVIAFDKVSGKEVWRALDTEREIGTSQPLVIEAGGAR